MQGARAHAEAAGQAVCRELAAGEILANDLAHALRQAGAATELLQRVRGVTLEHAGEAHVCADQRRVQHGARIHERVLRLTEVQRRAEDPLMHQGALGPGMREVCLDGCQCLQAGHAASGHQMDREHELQAALGDGQ